MGRGSDEARPPPIEILGADLGVGSTQTVAVGPRRPKPGRGRALLIALGVVALLGVGLALGDRGDDPGRAAEEERDNQARIDLDKPQTSTTRPTTTSRPTTTTAPVGPPLGVPVEGALLLFDGSSWQVVDMTTGAAHDVDLPPTDPYSSVTLRGGIAVPEGGQANFYPILGSGEEPEPVPLGPADVVLRAGADRVWLVDSPSESDDDPTPHAAVRLVDVRGTVLRSFQLPGRFVGDATDDVLLLARGGRVYAADEDGLRAIATGWLTGTIGNAALVTACDGDGSCALRRQPVDGGAGRVLLEVSDPDGIYFDSFEAPDGRVALYASNQFDSGGSLTFFGPTGEPLGGLDQGTGSFSSFPQWLPGDLGLVSVVGGTIRWLHASGDSWTIDDHQLPGGSPDSVFVVTP